ncbi:MAG: hypothetical protein IJJ14_02245, partial [Coriobacteriales bacterium]|nr:hypothetical protein [Coriobacteriales bacterium]
MSQEAASIRLTRLQERALILQWVVRGCREGQHHGIVGFITHDEESALTALLAQEDLGQQGVQAAIAVEFTR